MINILEITITLILLLLGNKISDTFKSENVEMHLDNGSIHYFEIHKNDKYACPKTCSVNHFHSTYIVNKNNQQNVSDITINNSDDSLTFERNNISEIYYIKKVKKNKKKYSIERDKVDINTFLKRYK